MVLTSAALCCFSSFFLDERFLPHRTAEEPSSTPAWLANAKRSLLRSNVLHENVNLSSLLLSGPVFRCELAVRGGTGDTLKLSALL